MTDGLKKLPARYSQKAQEAYGRFIQSNDLSGVAYIVLEAVLDYLPSKTDSQTPAPQTPEDLREDSRLMEDLGFDSLAVAELVFFLEEIFPVTINNVEIQSVRTLADLRQFVDAKLRESTAKPEA
jgi:acyl carrier protein